MFADWERQWPPEHVSDAERVLCRAVRTRLPGADEDTVRLVTCVAGLLAAVAYADRDYSEIERLRVEAELTRIYGPHSEEVEAICSVLSLHIADIAGSEIWCRELRQLAVRQLRLAVLDVLVDLAASDDGICEDEALRLVHIARSLGLSRADYDASEARHRDERGTMRFWN